MDRNGGKMTIESTVWRFVSSIIILQEITPFTQRHARLTVLPCFTLNTSIVLAFNHRIVHKF